MRLGFLRFRGLYRRRGTCGLSIYAAFIRTMRLVDDTVDGARSSPRGSREEYFAYIQRFLEREAAGDPIHETLLPEDVPLAYVIVATRRQLGFDPVPDMAQIIRDYAPDAHRIMSGRAVADAAVHQSAQSAYRLHTDLLCRMIGLDDQISAQYARIYTPTLVACDTFEDLLTDASRGIINIPREVLEEQGISPEAVLACRSWDELAQVPGFVTWYTGQVECWSQVWSENWEAMEELVAPRVRSRRARRRFRRGLHDMTRRLEACQTRFHRVAT